MSAPLHMAEPITVAPRARVFRTDIQALRAIAIGLVVLNHLWPVRLTGGYVGVDVFFVISGFLITGHLVGEITRTGGVRLGTFYARRIRRLLPAAFLVLVASLLLLIAFLPYPRWGRNAWEIAASAGYVENWFLAAMSVNYSALNDAASLVQHYWSLSVEEQFYIVWPLLLLVAVAISARVGRDATRSGRRTRVSRALVVIVVTVGLLSLGASIVYTILAPPQAYFATFTRGWEFAVGGGAALLGGRIRLSRIGADFVSLGGFALIAFSALAYDHATAFPGYAALVPVLGTAAVIIAGNSQATLWHAKVTALRPVQWLGGISYSLYLWHWPLIVVAPFVIGGEASTVSKLGVLAIAIVLAALTKRFVEDAGQAWGYWRTSTRRALLLMLAGMVLIGALVAGVLTWYQTRVDADRPPVQVVASSCEGPLALAPGADCADPFGPADYSVMTSKNEYFFTPPECGTFLPILSYGEKQTTLECDFSGGIEKPTKVWLVGDSHAQQWQGAIFDIARKEHWIVTTSYLGGCPVADVAFLGFRGPWGQAEAERCNTWSDEVSAAISRAKPELVVTAMAARQDVVDDGSGDTQSEQMSDGLIEYWSAWADEGIEVLALADPPYNGEVRDADCVLLNAADPRACARARDEAQPADPVVLAGAAERSDSITVLDLTDRFCDAERCYAVVGGIPVYYDADHLNLEYVRMLAPEISRTIDDILSDG
ncbi:O-acetyltransferase OatA [Microbacterium oxydans]|uniref:acyltransferase family protein n=1 Tax=Microbacterium oxydans TaxID=82380 RepID=UPI001DAC0832|nr:acyltransferase family protein [Microbacterium oxydans]CAH0129495.1 O-acetyltransferase OatA [Microbacterium oxydans]